MINFNMLLGHGRHSNREFVRQSYKKAHCSSCGKSKIENNNHLPQENNNHLPQENISKNMNEIVNSNTSLDNTTLFNYNSLSNKFVFEMPKVEYFGNIKKPCGEC